MKDWKSIASANELQIPDADLERSRAPLEALEAAFRPLAATIPHETEPAVMYQPEDGE